MVLLEDISSFFHNDIFNFWTISFFFESVCVYLIFLFQMIYVWKCELILIREQTV